MNFAKVIGVVKSTAKTVQTAFHLHSSAIYTGIGVAGLITAIPFAIKCKEKADQLYVEKQTEKEELGESPELSKKEKAAIFAKSYWPVCALVGVSTTSILLGHHESTKRIEALETAVVTSQKKLSSYEKQVTKELSNKKHTKVKDEAAKERALEIVKNGEEPENTGFGDQLMVELWSGRKYYSTPDRVRLALKDLNYEMATNPVELFTPVNNYYDHLGLVHSGVGNYMCWTYSADGLEVEPVFTYIEYEDGSVCVAYDFSVDPVYDCRIEK